MIIKPLSTFPVLTFKLAQQNISIKRLAISHAWFLFFCIALLLVVAPSQSQAQAVKQSFSDNLTEFSFANRASKLTINKKNFKIQLFDHTGHRHFNEYRAASFYINHSWVPIAGKAMIEISGANYATLRIDGKNGIVFKVRVQSCGDYGFNVRVNTFNQKAERVRGATQLNAVEELYGFGETWNGHVAQRGQRIEIWDKSGTPDECAYMPYYVSTQNYAFFLNYGGRVIFDAGQKKADELTYEVPADELNMTLLIGNNIPDVVNHFLKVVGMPAKPPRWSFKPWFWFMADPFNPGKLNNPPPYSNYTLPKTGTKSLKGGQVVKMVEKLHQLDIPIGVTWLEDAWQDARTSFKPDTAFSKDLGKLIKDLDQLGVKTLGWTVPYTTVNSGNWQVATKNGYLVKKNGVPDLKEKDVKITRTGELAGQYYNNIDFFKPEAFNWWQQELKKPLELGLRGFKLDAGQDLPEDAILNDKLLGKDVHNSYALKYNQVFYEALKRKFGDDFLMIPRAGWIGSSAYTNFKWPGDLAGSLAANGLPSSVYSSLSLAFCGYPFVSTDIGGFTDQPAAEDIWVRWAQFGALLPGMQTLHMPWWYSANALNHFRYLCWLHTDLTPFWNTLANEAKISGAPVIHPLVWDYQDDMETWRIDDEFTIGGSLLAAPVTDTRETKDIYLPKGRWINFWDEKTIYTGGKKVTWETYAQGNYRFPLYIKEGAIIPMDINNANSGFGNTFSKGFSTIAIWPKEQGQSDFTMDDLGGKVKFKVVRNTSSLDLTWDAAPEKYLFRLTFIRKGVPTAVRFGKQVSSYDALKVFDNFDQFTTSDKNGWHFDRANNRLWIRINDKGSAGFIQIVQ